MSRLESGTNKETGRDQREDKRIMTCDEVADFLRVHVSSVRRWTREGKLKGYRLGGNGDWRYSREDVLSFVFHVNHRNTSKKVNRAS